MMLKLKPFLSSIFPRIRYNFNQLYSKTAEKLEPVVSLTDALGAKTDTHPKPVDNSTVASNAVSIDNIPVVIAKEERILSKDEVKGATESVKVGTQADAKKTKKGKLCGKAKKEQPPKKSSTSGGDGFGFGDDKCDRLEIHRSNAKKWKNISYVLVPLALGLSAFILATKDEHPEPEYIPYEYMYKRTKRFPWGDGKKSFFHGHNNLLPEEEEQRLDDEGGDPPRYKKRVDKEEEKRQRREQHAKEELERRKKRHQEEEKASQ